MADGTVFMNIYTDTTGPIVNAIAYNGRMWWATTTTLSNVAIDYGTDGVGNGTWNGASQVNLSGHAMRTFANGGSVHPMVEINGKLYIADGNSVSILDDVANTFTNNVITLGLDELIVGFSYTGSMLSIYTTSMGAWKFARKYLWNVSATAPEARITFDGVGIANVVTKGNEDYLIGGSNSETHIFRSQGYSLRSVAKMGNIPPLSFQ